MTLNDKQNKILNISILIFLGISFISSQLSVAVSSIGVVGLIILFLIKIITGKKPLYYDKTLLFLLLTFFLWQIVSSVFSNDPASSLIDTLKKVSLFFIVICSISVIESKEQIKKLLTALFIFSILVSTYEDIKYIIDFRAQDKLSLGDFRLSYFGYPITLGEIKMLILILIVPFILSKEKFLFNKWVLIIITIPILLSLYFTNSRNALLGLFIGLVIIGIMKHRYFLIGLILTVFLFLYFAPVNVKERIVSIIDITHPSNAIRFKMWETGLQMMKDKPVTGFGDVDFLSIYKKYKQPESYAEGVHMHNNILHITLLYGITGLLIWLALMIYIFLNQIRAYQKFKKDEFWNIILISSITAMFAFQVSGLTEWNFCDAEFAVLLWFIFSFPFISNRLMMSENNG
ncbi:MAG TPA: O-antigen ligase family protein [Ignavibacteria bacterium]|nr:O-antigen ligase family protein [Ignavibacteria bacterium]